MATLISRAFLRSAVRGRANLQVLGRLSSQPLRYGRRGLATVSTIELPHGTHLTHEHDASTIRAQTGWHATEIPINGKNNKLSSIYLRDQCSCLRCVDPSSKQKNFSTTDIPPNIEGEVVGVNAGSVTIKWTNDIEGFGPDHVTTFSTTSVTRCENPQPRRLQWAAAQFEAKCKDVSFDDYMRSDTTLSSTLAQLGTYGLAFITDVPESQDSVSKIAERIGPVKNTLYGYTWDVRSVPDATNVAYTSKDLGFHMDLLPMGQAPQLQVLHCIRSSAKGGSSQFTDAYTAAQQLWKQDPNAYLALCDFPVTFHYDHPETHLYKQILPVLSTNFRSKGLNRLQEHPYPEIPIERIRWSPPFQGPFIQFTDFNSSSIDNFGDSLAQWRDAAAKFDALIHQQANIHERLMKPGECVIFENTRVLHARTAFEVDDAGKERWLRGCYLDGDVYDSKMRVLWRKLHGTKRTSE